MNQPKQIQKTIPVEEAIRKGHRMITWPVMVIVLSIFLFVFYMGGSGTWPVWTIVLAVPAAIIPGNFYKSAMTHHWKIWALQYVQNVHEFKRKAELDDLYNADFFGMEVATPAQKRRLRLLEKKLREPEVFIDRNDIPVQTKTYPAKRKWFLYITAAIVGITGFLITGKPVQLLLVAPVVIIMLIEFTTKPQSKPHLVIDSKGIATLETPFRSWAEISNERLVSRYENEDDCFYLVYDYRGEYQEFRLTDLLIDPKYMDTLLVVYRGRYEQEQQNKTEKTI